MGAQNCKTAKLRARVRQLTVRDLKGLGDDDAAAAEAGRLKAREARLKARIRLGTADGVPAKATTTGATLSAQRSKANGWKQNWWVAYETFSSGASERYRPS